MGGKGWGRGKNNYFKVNAQQLKLLEMIYKKKNIPELTNNQSKVL